MLSKPRIYLFFPTRLINLIKHEDSCKILHVFPKFSQNVPFKIAITTEAYDSSCVILHHVGEHIEGILCKLSAGALSFS